MVVKPHERSKTKQRRSFVVEILKSTKSFTRGSIWPP